MKRVTNTKALLNRLALASCVVGALAVAGCQQSTGGTSDENKFTSGSDSSGATPKTRESSLNSTPDAALATPQTNTNSNSIPNL